MTALAHLAARASRDPFFLAHALLSFARARNLDDDALAEYLGVTPERLTNLKLCGQPQRPEHYDEFAAAFPGLDVGRLREVCGV